MLNTTDRHNLAADIHGNAAPDSLPVGAIHVVDVVDELLDRYVAACACPSGRPSELTIGIVSHAGGRRVSLTLTIS